MVGIHFLVKLFQTIKKNKIMRKLYFIAFVILFSFTVSAQYTYKLKGQKELVGERRNFYGTDTVNVSNLKKACGCKPHADYQNQLTQNLGNLFPDMGLRGRGLFWNFDKKGDSHLTELDGSVEIFQVNGCAYAKACGNLIKLEEFAEKIKVPEKVERKPQPEPEPEQEEYVPAPKRESFERRIVGFSPPAEAMTFVCAWARYEPPCCLRYVTQAEALDLINSSGCNSGWRILSDADKSFFREEIRMIKGR